MIINFYCEHFGTEVQFHLNINNKKYLWKIIKMF